MFNFRSIKKYRCPKDATSSRKMSVFLVFPQGLRNENLPNELLHCPTCDKLYRWKDLKEMNIVESVGDIK